MEASQQSQNPRQPPRRQPPPEALTEQAAIAALVALILADLRAAEFKALSGPLLGALGLPLEAIGPLIDLIHPNLLDGLSGDRFVAQMHAPGLGAAEKLMIRTTPPRHANYLIHAARRLRAGGFAAEDERRYMSQHLAAERGRYASAKRVDEAATEFGPILGWYAIRDEVTTPGCRAAHGTNFHFERPPLVEGNLAYPGSLHAGACRCRPGRPFALAA